MYNHSDPLLPTIPPPPLLSPFLLPSILSLLFPPSQGNLSPDSVVLEGQVTRGRFGTSVTNLGDIDDDGYEGVCMRCDCASEAMTVCL